MGQRKGNKGRLFLSAKRKKHNLCKKRKVHFAPRAVPSKIHHQPTTRTLMTSGQDYRETGVCRCCLSEGTYKSMELQYAWAGKEENYTDMLRDAFEMTLMRVKTASLICSMCVMRLRDACAFRRQVYNAERSFFQHSLGRVGVQIKIEQEESDSVVEVTPAAVTPEDDDLAQLDSEDDLAQLDSEDDLAHLDSEDDAPLSTIPQARRPSRPPTVLAETGGQHENGKQGEQLLVENAALHTGTEKSKPRRTRNYEKECELCKKIFKNTYALRQHMHDSHPSDVLNYKCPDCPKSFLQSTMKLKHMIYSHGFRGDKETFTCKECNAHFPTNQKRYDHMKEFHGYRRRIHCPKCPEILKNLYTRKKHMENVHGAEFPKFPCGACDTVSTSKWSLIIHQRNVHMRERNVSCTQCDSKFFSKGQLKKHMVRHGEVERMYQCEYCKKKFPRKSTLRSHTKIHTGDKRKVCKLCGQAFVQRASLKYHMTRYHPGAADV